MKMDIRRIKTDSFGLIIFSILQKLMDACDPHQGRNVSAFHGTNGGSDTNKIAANSKN
jgi:hypothetical protein